MAKKRLAVIDADRCVGCQSCMFACTRRLGFGGVGKSAIHVSSVGGIERGFSVRVCRACPDPPCIRLCPEDALVLRPGGGVILHKDRCTGCGSCLDGCIIGAISWDKEENHPVICIYCGYCANYCPYGVIELQEVNPDD
ncbi:4Fe-4S binding protein [Methanospirillum stamsii]|nr:4Fe-4S binding protein [Methanospirillum stamsii]